MPEAAGQHQSAHTPAGRVLALDVGTQRVGVAVGSFLSAPQALVTLSAASLPQALAPLLREWQPSALVLGLPLNAAGEETVMSRRVRALARRLQQQSGLVVHFHNEYLSSHAAPRGPAAGRAGRDAHAAALILAGWLETRT
jgi:putative Holliday junction resolvase